MCVSASGVIVITRFVGAAVSAVLLSATGVFFVDGFPTKAAAPQRVKRKVAARRMVDRWTAKGDLRLPPGRQLERSRPRGGDPRRRAADEMDARGPSKSGATIPRQLEVSQRYIARDSPLKSLRGEDLEEIERDAVAETLLGERATALRRGCRRSAVRGNGAMIVLGGDVHLLALELERDVVVAAAVA